MILPPENLFFKLASILTKIIGYIFILDGIVALFVLTPIIIFLSQGESPDKIFFISAVFIGSIVSILIGVFVLKDAMRYIEIIYAKFKESF